MKANTFCRAIAAFAITLTATSPGWAASEIGMLKCDTSIGIGEILVRKQTMTCAFVKKDGTTETYSGSVKQFGVEIGEVKEGHLIWGVFAISPATGTGLLAGKYAGAEASIAAGIGLGADVLVGGTGKSFILQPLAIESEPGVGIAVGVQQVELTATQ
jgi:hypothetical protein